MSSNPTFPESKSAAAGAAKDAMNAAADAAKQTADKAANLGRDTVNKLDSSREPVAQSFQRTADAIRSYAPDAVADQAHSTADAIEDAAGYIRTRDIRGMGADLTESVRRNPGPSLIAAVAVGFLLGLVMHRND
jgi:ElaB/YqjD/DUF883 family membrane-anchored ribosome-binding protein